MASNPAVPSNSTTPDSADETLKKQTREKADFHHKQAHHHLRTAHHMAKDIKAKHHLNEAAKHVNKLHGMATGDNYSSTPSDETGMEYGRD